MNEFVFRFNRRRSHSRGMVFYRVLDAAEHNADLAQGIDYADLAAPSAATAPADGELPGQLDLTELTGPADREAS
jgi:hypothetical protein